MGGTIANQLGQPGVASSFGCRLVGEGCRRCSGVVLQLHWPPSFIPRSGVSGLRQMRATNAGHRGSASVNVVHSIASFGPTWPAHPAPEFPSAPFSSPLARMALQRSSTTRHVEPATPTAANCTSTASLHATSKAWRASTKSQKVRLRARRRSVSLALVNAGVRMREKSLEKAQQTDGSIIASRQSNDNK